MRGCTPSADEYSKSKSNASVLRDRKAEMIVNAMNSTADRFRATTVFKGLMFVCALEFFVAAAFLPTVYHRNESIAWPITTGMVSGVELKEWIHKPHVEPSFKPVIFYDYTVNGVTHRGARVSFDDDDG